MMVNMEVTKLEITKKKLVLAAVAIFVAGFLGGVLTEHIIHGLQAKKSDHHGSEEHHMH